VRSTEKKFFASCVFSVPVDAFGPTRSCGARSGRQAQEKEMKTKVLNHGREASTMSVVACDGVSINDLAFTPTRLLWLGTGTNPADLSLMSLYTLAK
jgi:hypothetical protein